MRFGDVELAFNPVIFPVLVVLWMLGLLWPGLLIITAILVHELAHVLMASILGLTIDVIEILPLGCVVRLVEMLEVDPSVEARVATVGPLVSLGLGGLCLLAFRFFPGSSLQGFAWINLAVGILNLLPALPLDGGRIFRAALVYHSGFYRGTKRARRLSVLVGWLAIVGGLAVCFYRPAGVCLISLGIFILLSLRRDRRRNRFVFIGYLLARRLRLFCRERISTCHLAFGKDTTLKKVIANLNHRDYHMIWVVNDRWRLLGCVDEGELLEAALLQGVGTKLGSLVADPPSPEQRSSDQVASSPR